MLSLLSLTKRNKIPILFDILVGFNDSKANIWSQQPTIIIYIEGEIIPEEQNQWGFSSKTFPELPKSDKIWTARNGPFKAKDNSSMNHLKKVKV